VRLSLKVVPPAAVKNKEEGLLSRLKTAICTGSFASFPFWRQGGPRCSVGSGEGSQPRSIADMSLRFSERTDFQSWR